MQSHQMKRAAGNSAPIDSNFKQTVLLLHGDGTNGGQNNTFIDGSTNNFTVTRSGTVTQGAFSPFSQPDGYWSNHFDGTNDYLGIANNAALQPGTGTFTIEAWIYTRASGVDYAIYAKGGASTGFVFQVTSTNVLRFTDTTTNIDSTGTISANQWVHVAAVREGTGSNQLKLYINGVNDGTGTSSTNFNQTEEARIGTDRSAGSDFHGYISNLRFVKGSAVYTGTFTPPASPLTAIANTSLLTCQSNRMIDNSSNAFTLTKSATVTVTPFSSFAPTNAYVASTNGGSGFFAGDLSHYLTIADNTAFDFGTGDFTIEAWVYLNSVLSGYAMIGATSDVNNYFAVNTANVIMYNGTTEIRGSATINLTEWNHIVWQVSGGNAQMYCNGTRVYNTAYATFGTSQTGMYVGRSLVYSNYYTDGYISNFRVVVGSAVYSGATITVPTAPLTAVTNTKLLLNFINAAVFDNAAKNNINTVGNAQISTTQAKFGTGSLYFDGTGDWLIVIDQLYLRLGTGNFTIELWVYLASGDTGSNRGLIGKGTSTTGWLVSLNTTQKLVFTYTTSTITSTGSITTNAWNHIAVVREGTGSNQTKIYINGTNDGTGTVSTDFTQAENMYVGADRSASSPMKGYIDDVRVTAGVARYTANFTVPARAFPDK